MDKKPKITTEIVPIEYPHNQKGMEGTLHDITLGELHVFERENRSPVFVVFESYKNLGPGLGSITQKIADSMNDIYKQDPYKIQWFERRLEPKDPEKPYERVKFGRIDEKWGEIGREFVTKEDVERAMSYGLVTEPEPRDRIKPHDYWPEGKLPKLSIEQVMKARNEHENEPDL